MSGVAAYYDKLTRLALGRGDRASAASYGRQARAAELAGLRGTPAAGPADPAPPRPADPDPVDAMTDDELRGAVLDAAIEYAVDGADDADARRRLRQVLALLDLPADQLRDRVKAAQPGRGPGTFGAARG